MPKVLVPVNSHIVPRVSHSGLRRFLTEPGHLFCWSAFGRLKDDSEKQMRPRLKPSRDARAKANSVGK